MNLVKNRLIQLVIQHLHLLVYGTYLHPPVANQTISLIGVKIIGVLIPGEGNNNVSTISNSFSGTQGVQDQN